MTLYEGYARVTHKFTGTGVPTGAAIVYAVKLESGLTPVQVANAAHDAWGDFPIGWQSSTVTLSQTLVKFGPDETGADGTSTDAARVGAAGGASTAPNISTLVTKRTLLGGRRGKGRLYMPGLVEANVDQAGLLLGTYVTGLQTTMDSWLADLSTRTIPLYLEHEPTSTWIIVDGRPRRFPSLVPAPAPTAVVSLAVSPTAATQRRRMRR